MAELGTFVWLKSPKSTFLSSQGIMRLTSLSLVLCLSCFAPANFGCLKKIGKKIERAVRKPLKKIEKPVTKPIKMVARGLDLVSTKKYMAEFAQNNIVQNNVAPNFDDRGGAPTVPEQIQMLKELLDEGIITQAQFDAAVAKVIG